MFQKCDCIYCTTFDNFPILWKLTEDIFWYEIPKNATTSIKEHYFGTTFNPSVMNKYLVPKTTNVEVDPLIIFKS